MQTYFSSDWHLGHTNILKYDNRPFASIEEMNEVIIGNHNSIVKPEDHFYFLGDFVFSKKKDEIEAFMKQLNGKLFFIKGNHDHTDTRKIYTKYGSYLGDMATITVEE